MNTRRGLMILDIAAGLFLLVAGGLAGMALDRIRFESQRVAMLAHVEAVVRANQGTPMAIESVARSRRGSGDGAPVGRRGGV